MFLSSLLGMGGRYKESCSTTQTWHLMQLVSPKVPWSEGVWFPEETRKHATLVWIAAQNILSTGDRLIKWNPQAVSKCWLCNDPMETRDHLFFTCSYAVAIWSNLIQNFLGGRYFYQWNQLLQLVVAGIQDNTDTFFLQYCCQTTVYALWHERNMGRVGEPSKSPSAVTTLIEKKVWNRITLQADHFFTIKKFFCIFDFNFFFTKSCIFSSTILIVDHKYCLL